MPRAILSQVFVCPRLKQHSYGAMQELHSFARNQGVGACSSVLGREISRGAGASFNHEKQEKVVPECPGSLQVKYDFAAWAVGKEGLCIQLVNIGPYQLCRRLYSHPHKMFLTRLAFPLLAVHISVNRNIIDCDFK